MTLNGKGLLSVGVLGFGLLLASCTSNSSTSTPISSASNGSSTTSAMTVPRTPSAMLEAVVVNTEALKSVHLAMNVSETGSVAGHSMDISLTGSGDIDLINKTSSFTMNESSPSVPSPLGNMTIDVVNANNTSYISGSAFKGMPGVTKQWISAEDTNLSGSSALEAALTDPTSMLSILARLGTVTLVGQTSVNGQSATQYHVVVDVAKAAAAEGTTGFGTAMKCLGETNFPIDVFVDSSGRVIEVKYAWDISSLMKVSGFTMIMNATVDFSNFNKPVSIAIPPASEVQSFSSLYPTATSASHSC